jgi:hypothetical protein
MFIKFSLAAIINSLEINTSLISLLVSTYPLSKNLLNIFCLVLPIFFAFSMYRFRWIGFLLGISSFVLMASISSILECFVPNGHCSSENTEGGTFQLFAIFGFFYSLFALTTTSILKSMLRHSG